MIVQRMMVRGVRTELVTWQFTINTEATTPGAKKAAIPFNLYSQPQSVLDVFWGDGESTLLRATDFYNDSALPEHIYSNAGIYQITIRFFNSGETYLQTSGASMLSFSDILISVDTPIPKLKGVQKKYGGSPLERGDNSLRYAFYKCDKLVSVCENLLINNKELTNVSSMLSNCKSLSSVPSGLFGSTPSLSDVSYTLFNCDSVNDFTLHIVSPSITSVTGFASPKAGATRTIYVPSGSTTETTFNAVASSLSLTIIGE